MLSVQKTSNESHGSSTALDVPDNLLTASFDEARQVLPFCYAFAMHRRRSFENRRMTVRYSPPAVHDDEYLRKQRRPRDCYVEMIYPFSTNLELRDLYRMFRYDKPRLGLLLEDLDTFAGDVAIRHCGLPSRMLLTAAIDKISWLQAAIGVSDEDGEAAMATHEREMGLNHDLRVAGQVNWVGKSSVGVLIELSVHGEDGLWHVVGSARFVMVSRELNQGLPMQVPDLLITTEREKFLFEDGQENARLGRQRRSAHIRPHEPSAEELAELIRVMRATKKRTYAAVMRVSKESSDTLPKASASETSETSSTPADTNIPPAVSESDAGIRTDTHKKGGRETSLVPVPKPTGSPRPTGDAEQQVALGAAVPMRRTELLSAALMQHQDRNHYDVIFGGHLLCLAYEHASAAAALHAGRLCTGLSMDDVTFRAPVPIGCLLQLRAQVVFVEGPVLRVHVTASKMASELSPGEAVVTNTFSFAFLNRKLSPNDSGPEYMAAPPVYPETLSEAMEYVAGLQRHVNDDVSTRAVARWSKQVARETAVESEARAAEAAALVKLSQNQPKEVPADKELSAIDISAIIAASKL